MLHVCEHAVLGGDGDGGDGWVASAGPMGGRGGGDGGGGESSLQQPKQLQPRATICWHDRCADITAQVWPSGA